MIILKDFTVRVDPSSGTRVSFLDDDHVFVDIFSDEDAASTADRAAPLTLKIRRFGPLTVLEASDGPILSMDAPFEVPLNIQSLNIAVLVSNPESGNKLVGRIKLDTDYLQEKSLSADNKFSVPFPSNNAKLVMSVECIYIPDDNQQSNESVGSLSHAKYQLTLQGYRNGASRLRSIGEHFANHFEDSGRQEHIDQAISYYEHAVSLAVGDAHLDDQFTCVGRLGTLFLRRSEYSGDLTDIEKAISHLKQAVHLTPDDHSDKPTYLNELGHSFSRCFVLSGNLIDIKKAISHLEDAVLLTPDGHSDKPAHLSNLGGLVLRQFGHTGDLSDIEKAISHLEHAVLLTPDGHAGKPGRLSNLGSSFGSRFKHTGDLIDIEKAISHLGQAVLLTPDGHSDKPAYLSNLGLSHSAHFDHTGDLIDIEKAISHLEHAVLLTPDGHSNKPDYLNNLGSSFLRQFGYAGDLSDIEKAISYLEQAVLLTPDSHSDKPYHLSNLGSSFASWFKHTGDLIDIEKAISHLGQAVLLTPDGHSKKPGYLDNLGISFLQHSRHTGDLINIGKAISHIKHAILLTPDGHSGKPAYLNNLGNSFSVQFGYTGDLIDIEKAISYHKHAVLLTSDAHSSKPIYLNNLGSSFSRCFEHTGNLIDIENAITHQEHSVFLTPNGHSEKPNHLNSLGKSFLVRFIHTGNLIDLEKAISHLEHAVLLTPDSHSNKPARLNNLGSSFLSWFRHTGNLVDIKKAISYYEHAVLLTPDGHSDKPACLNNLGSSFLGYFGYTKDLIDIDKAISHQEHAVLLTPDGHSGKPGRLNDLASSYSSRFWHTGDLIDIEKAISHQQHAVLLIPDDYSYRPLYLYNLGTSFLRRLLYSVYSVDTDKAISHHKHATHPTLDVKTSNDGLIKYLEPLGMTFLPQLPSALEGTLDLEQALLSFKACAKSSTGHPSVLFNASLQWAQLSGLADISVSLLGYEHAMSLLPRIAWLGQSITTRYKHLTSIGSISTTAAAAAIASERPDLALEWLEQGHSIVWHQLFNLRTPVDDLSIVNPSLAADLVSTSQALESAAMHDATSDESTSRSQLSLEETAQAHHRLAEKWDRLLEDIRKLPGFENFLHPKRLSTLLKAASHGSIAVINVHKSQSDALVLIPGCDDAVHIALDSSLYDKAQVWQQSLNDELQAAGMGVRDARAGQLAHHESNSSGFARILAGLWTDVVKPILDGLAIQDPSSSDPPRIWWCPTGPLTFLPIHAAGIYTQSPPGPNLLDFAISSYTPTVSALLEASRNTPKLFKGLLGASQSDTPGLSRLPNADKELELIKQLIPDPNVHILQGELATVESVLNKMEEASWVHFACHAEQNGSLPLQSAFRLNDGPLTLSEIMKKSFPNADFAFLSACETATGDKNLPDEAVHLAAGMLVAGYRSVIATMWSIGDRDAPLIASEVYSHLTSGPDGPDSAKAAYALHHAVKRLRAQVGTDAFLSWVPYIHVGK